MKDVTLTATPKGNGFQATVRFSGEAVASAGFSSAETFPTAAEAIAAAALKVLDMPERLAIFDIAS